jgi:hypothetical protein
LEISSSKGKNSRYVIPEDFNNFDEVRKLFKEPSVHEYSAIEHLLKWVKPNEVGIKEFLV